VFAVLLALDAALCAGFYWAMSQPPDVFGHIVAKTPFPLMMILPFETMWNSARGGRLKPGDPAPDFRLPTLDHKTAVQLSAFRGSRPVVLVFGSYTWPPFRREVPALNQLFDTYQDRVAFYAVYIQEAHPSDIWQMRSNVVQGVVFQNPRTESERVRVADSCVRTLGIRFPALIDGMDNSVEKLYTGWPDRLFLIDREGRVAYKSTPGPFGFHPEQLEAAVRKVL
jgi:peroxiredoxin